MKKAKRNRGRTYQQSLSTNPKSPKSSSRQPRSFTKPAKKVQENER